MVSDRDLRSYTAGAESVRVGLEGARGDVPVSRIMARAVEEISPDEEMRSAAQRMLDAGYGALVVIDGKNLTGIVSYVDVLRAYLDLE
jgi:CBS domain-containing protein